MGTTGNCHDDTASPFPTHGHGGLQASVDLDDKEGVAELLGDNVPFGQ